jgi:lipid-A-disaccharide synthase
MAKTSLLMVAGERSGDVYAGELARALRAQLPELEIFGCGGEALRQGGAETVVDAQEVALMGITEVVGGLPRAYRAFRRLMAEVDRRRPRLAVLIDSPSLNLRLAKRLKRRGIPVVYFVSPQIWAWKKWRLRHIRARVNKMLCLFDFEVEIYRRAGIPVEHVGHPLVDLVRPHLQREEFFALAGLDPNLPTVTLLPGSRPKEIALNLPTLLETTRRLSEDRKIQFVLAVSPSLDAERVKREWLGTGAAPAALRVLSGVTHDALHHADLALVASGTATLEAALLERPMVVVYRVSPLTWQFGRFLVNVPFYCMVNLLAGRQVVPELIQDAFTARGVAAEAQRLLDQPQARAEMLQGLREVKARLGPGGAIPRAAQAILEALREAPEASSRG